MYFSRIRITADIRDLHLLIAGNGYGTHQLLWKLFPETAIGRRFLFREELAREQIPFHRGVRGEPVFYTISAARPVDHPLFKIESKVYCPQISEGDRLAFRFRGNPTISRKREGKKNSVRHDVVMDAQYHLLLELARIAGCPSTGGKSAMKRQILTAWHEVTNRARIEEHLNAVIAESGTGGAAEMASVSPSRMLELAITCRIKKALETWVMEKGEYAGFAVMCDDARTELKLQAKGYQWHPLPTKGREAGFSTVDFEGELEVVDADRFRRTLYNGIGPAKGFGCGLMMVRRLNSRINLR